MIMKWLHVNCEKCGYDDDIPEYEPEFDKALEEDWICPGCSKKVLDAI